jgi:AraC-like DNA-binding protein
MHIDTGSSRRFVDPDQYQEAIRGGDNLYSILGRGVFNAELTNIEVGRLTLQRGRENLPRLASSSMPPNRVGIVVWFGDSQRPVVRGVQMLPGELLCLGAGMQSHHRTFGSNDFAALTLDSNDLANAAIDLTGQELAVTAGKVLRPPEYLLIWLLSVIEAATGVAATTPGIFTSPLAAEALEHALLRPMIMCLINAEARDTANGHHARIAKRFKAAVEANVARPLLNLDLSRIVGVTERQLRTVCQEQLGISPGQFLKLRRLHLARQVLVRSDHHSMSVTQIAMDHGISEFGRFAVSYKLLFGESPSTTLRRPPTYLASRPDAKSA